MQASCLRSPTRRLKMQRNSAYFLFLAVLAMLVIGVVMLYSTSAFARDAHGDVYFFIKRQSLWLGIYALIGATTFVMMFVAGTNAILLGVFSASALGGFIFTATCMPERMSRLLAFLHPENYKQDAGLQQMQALIAWGSGGMEGLGLGNGRQKMLYLPYAH